ncbi:hypothetical protein AXE80_05200 [Wenyingzhuangia fucanilytica]|uniref:Sulfatase N-terminal domain-containing protein n=1 Tax=Wenyingzhuangia fucanilytica TaxID=1790137 RepID=A0A1B1Y4N7_9FLAO|nr:sulfatase-like hydrolase/transferase [Wenyingzhuangia fucanilytica]ANW95709.1 hypothetical protein AXE80_05200 [Wenyingzhuangia fucanilytica]
MKLKNILITLSLIGFIGSVHAQQKPNIVFIEVDDLPAHYTSILGQKNAKTPTIDKLAKEGIFFSNAVSQGTMCGPSRNSLITGVYPHNIGFYQNGPFDGLELNTWALPAALQRAGYYTAHVGKSHIHPSEKGLKGSKVEKGREAHKRLGFDYVWQSLGRSVVGGKEPVRGKDAYVDFLLDNGYFEQMKKERRKNSTLPTDVYLDGLYTKLALEFMSNQKEQPFFLWLNYSVPHGPYDVAQKYHDPFTKKMMPTPNYVEDPGTDIPALLRPYPMTDAHEIEKEQLGNFANIYYMDTQVNIVLNKIKELGKTDNTIIVFFSDHGILVGDHGLNHKSTLYKEVINPSLIVYDPRSNNNGRTVDTPVELQDILKTTMEWAGASKKDINTPYGESLAPLLQNKKGYTKTFAVAESPGYYTLVTKEYKYIAPFEYQKDGFEVLFDLKKDPNEKTNIAKENPKVIKEFRLMAKEWLNNHGEVKIQAPMKPKKKKENKEKKAKKKKNKA